MLQLVVAMAFYPNLALPGENNHERSSAECVFHTRHVPFVNLHPSSVPWSHGGNMLRCTALECCLSARLICSEWNLCIEL